MKNVLNLVPLITGLIVMGILTGLAISDVGEKPDPKYCERVHTALDMATVAIILWIIFLFGVFSGSKLKDFENGN